MDATHQVLAPAYQQLQREAAQPANKTLKLLPGGPAIQQLVRHEGQATKRTVDVFDPKSGELRGETSESIVTLKDGSIRKDYRKSTADGYQEIVLIAGRDGSQQRTTDRYDAHGNLRARTSLQETSHRSSAVRHENYDRNGNLVASSKTENNGQGRIVNQQKKKDGREITLIDDRDAAGNHTRIQREVRPDHSEIVKCRMRRSDGTSSFTQCSYAGGKLIRTQHIEKDRHGRLIQARSEPS